MGHGTNCAFPLRLPPQMVCTSSGQEVRTHGASSKLRVSPETSPHMICTSSEQEVQTHGPIHKSHISFETSPQQ